jgi:hypothetical protein
MNGQGEEKLSRIEVVHEGAEWSVRENGRTLIRFFGRPAAVDLGCALAKNRAPSEIVIRRSDGSVEWLGAFSGASSLEAMQMLTGLSRPRMPALLLERDRLRLRVAIHGPATVAPEFSPRTPGRTGDAAARRPAPQ